MIGQTISHYKILEKLGEGGMGVVYKAEDLKLRRTVALKFLPHHLTTAETERERFLQEAQAAATLNHPNVCVIHAIEESGSHQFIVMECVEGKTLRQIVQSTHPTLQSAVTYAIQIGEALHEAHTRGVVHRDVKAENIMVNTKNQIKVMDFGLAKLKGSLKLTRTSSTVGTLAYMAPEQIQGGEVDARSDIFSFGVVLFEMLTGHWPFRGEHEAAIMYSILNEDAEQLTKYQPDASPELLHILGRALEKDPEDRYQSVHDMVIDLRRLKKESTKVSRSTQPVAPVSEQAPQPVRESVGSPQVSRGSFRKKMVVGGVSLLIAAVAVVAYFLMSPQPDSGERLPIAVADFVNETKEEELNGLSGMLITSLEQSRKLAVLTRSRMYDILKQTGRDNVERIDEATGREICRQAGIASLVVASIRKFDQLYIIDLKVLDPVKNEYVLTAKEEGQGKSSIPSMIDKLSERTRLGLREQSEDVRAASKKVADVTTTNLEAYQHYFHGEQLINKLAFDDAAKAFRRAVAIDTTFALAYYRLAYALSWSGDPGARPAIAKAIRHINRIPEKDRPIVHGYNALLNEDIQKALAIYREYLVTNPDDKEVIYNIGDYSYHLQDYPAAVAHLQRVLSLDPTFERAYQHLCWTYQASQRFDDGLKIARQFVAKIPDVESYNLLADAYLNQAHYDSAVQVYKQAVALFPSSAVLRRNLALTHLFDGDVGSCEAELAKLVQPNRDVEDQVLGSQGMAVMNIYLGRYREALRMNEVVAGLHQRNNNVAQLAQALAGRALLLSDLLGDTAAARASLRQALEYQLEGDAGFSNTLLRVYMQLGDFEEARSIGKQFVAIIFPKYQYLIDAYASRRAGNLPAAITSLLALQPEAAGLVDRELYMLGKAYYDNGEYDKAIRTLLKIQSGLSMLFAGAFDRTTIYGKSLYVLGQAYERNGEPKKAIGQYERLLTIWKDADAGIPEYVGAKERLAKLKGLAG